MTSRDHHSASAAPRSSGIRPPSRRAQTTLDFAIGVSVFLIAMVFVLSFVPGMLQPFEESGSQNNVVADRVASSVTEGMLADPDEPFILDADCTRAFFETDDPENTDGDNHYSYGSECNFEDVDPAKRLGIQGFPSGTGPNVNVTVVGDVNDVDGGEDDQMEILCVDANSDARIIDSGDPFDDSDGAQCDLTGGDDDFLFVLGPKPPTDTGSVAVARRVVSIEDHTAVVIVRAW